MIYINPIEVARYVYLKDSQLRFRTNRLTLQGHFPDAPGPAGKPLPLYTETNHPVAFIGPKGFFYIQETLPFLQELNALLPPDTPLEHLSADKLPWPVQRAWEASNVTAEAFGITGAATGFKNWRDATMYRLYKAMRAKGMGRVDAVKEVAVRFICPDPLVVRVIDRLDPRDRSPRRTGEYLKDPRYKLLSGVVQRGRALANNSGRGGSFSIDDVLINRKTIPTHCPVLGVELKYEGVDPRRALDAAVVGRLDGHKPYDAGNVAVMTKLASRLISGAMAESRAVQALTGVLNERWVQWMKDNPTKYVRKAVPEGRKATPGPDQAKSPENVKSVENDEIGS